MAITDIQISEELETGAPSIKYEGKEFLNIINPKKLIPVNPKIAGVSKADIFHPNFLIILPPKNKVVNTVTNPVVLEKFPINAK